ncbi:MAG: VanZ family protein [DPANN group archaeon]|nr:VanZ family protein [DPANN group archaeon]
MFCHCFQKCNKYFSKSFTYSIVWSFLIIIGSLMPGSVLDAYPVISPLSNPIHLFEFMVLSVLLLFAAKKYSLSNYFLIFTFLIVFGTSLEFLQGFVPGRFPSIYDVFADGLGSIIGLVFFYTFLRLKESSFEGTNKTKI